MAEATMNVLYLLSDDMRADLGSYGIDSVHTPNLDALASQSLVFEHAYSQISVCSPSRQSFMTSLRPDTNKVYNFIDSNPETAQAIPGHFRDHGYLTLGLGKTFHEELGQWNAERYWNMSGPAGLPYFPYKANTCPIGNEGGGQCIIPDEQIYDYSLRLEAIKYLRHAAKWSKETSEPFFLMAGFRDPHAPWAAPQRMYDLYDEDDIDLPLPEARVLGSDTPLIAWSRQLNVCLVNGTSFRYKYDEAVPEWVMRNQRMAYYASVSYVDEHVGAILDVLEEEGLSNSTIVVFHSDHGYALGEHGYWEKKSNFDLTVRVPLIMRVPGVTDQEGYNGKTSELFDLVDVFPTLSTLAGLFSPINVDGMDLSNIVLNGRAHNTKTIRGRSEMARTSRSAAYHQYPACGVAAGYNSTRQSCNYVEASEFDCMGYSIRTRQWRYTAWYQWDGVNLVADWDGDYADELYDHRGDDSSDLGKWEQDNLSAILPDVARDLRSKLELFFRKGEGNDTMQGSAATTSS